MAAVEEAVPVDVLSAALYVRFRSRQEHTFAEKVLSAMREKFGGHVERPRAGDAAGGETDTRAKYSELDRGVVAEGWGAPLGGRRPG